MSRLPSFYDWKRNWEKKKKGNEKTKEKREAQENSLGMNSNEFKEFIKKWKEKKII